MSYYFITVKHLKERYPSIEDFTGWESTLKSLGGHIIARNLEIGKTQTLHLHLVVRLSRNIFWNRLRGAPPRYHVYQKLLNGSGDIGRCILYMYKDGILSDEYIKQHQQEMMWRDAPYSFIEETPIMA